MGSIHGLPPSAASHFSPVDVPQAAREFSERITAFSQGLQQLLQQRESLSHDPAFLLQMQDHITALAQAAKQNTGE